jgi:hypothetical protein
LVIAESEEGETFGVINGYQIVESVCDIDLVFGSVDPHAAGALEKRSLDLPIDNLDRL